MHQPPAAGNVKLKHIVEGFGEWSATPAWLHPEGTENDVEALFAEYPQDGSFLAVSLDMGAEGETNYYLYVRDAEQQWNYQFLLRMFSDDNTVDIMLDESEGHHLPGATDLHSAAKFLCSEQPWWQVPLTTPILRTRAQPQWLHPAPHTVPPPPPGRQIQFNGWSGPQRR